VVIMLTDAAWS